MKMVKKKFRSYEQHQLQQISDMVCDNIEELLNILGITEYKLLNNLGLIYKKKNTVRMAQIDMQDFKVLADRELAKMSEFKK